MYEKGNKRTSLLTVFFFWGRDRKGCPGTGWEMRASCEGRECCKRVTSTTEAKEPDSHWSLLGGAGPAKLRRQFVSQWIQ